MLPLTAAGPGEGPMWERLAGWVREQLPAAEVDGVWVFRVLRRDQREFGTAVISRVQGDRRRIYTARYAAIIKGKQRGGFESSLDEVGSGPLEALHELLALVPVRADDEDPPTAVESWRVPADPISSSTGAAGVAQWAAGGHRRDDRIPPVAMADEARAALVGVFRQGSEDRHLVTRQRDLVARAVSRWGTPVADGIQRKLRALGHKWYATIYRPATSCAVRPGARGTTSARDQAI